MEIKKQDLLTALEIVKPGLASKELIEQSTSFAFIGNRVVTYNDEISISHPVEGLDLTGAVQAEELYKLLNKLKKDEVSIEVRGGEIVMQSGRTKASFTLQEEIKLPLDEIGNRGKWKKLPEDFIHFLKLSIGAASTNMSEPKLTCIHVHKEGRIEASDGYKVSRSTLGEEFPIDTFLIPATSASELVKMAPVRITDGEGWVHFRTKKGTQISCRTFDDVFPKIDHLLEVVGMEIEFPETILEIVEKATIFSKRNYFLDEQLTITLGNRKVKVESKSETAKFEESAIMKNYTEEPFSFNVTPYLLKDILERTRVCILSDDKLKFEGAGWEYITALRN